MVVALDRPISQDRMVVVGLHYDSTSSVRTMITSTVEVTANGPGGHAMKMNGKGMWIGVTVVALGAGMLAIPPSQGQRAAGISRVGWLEVCSPGPKRPHFDIFRTRLAEL